MNEEYYDLINVYYKLNEKYDLFIIKVNYKLNEIKK